MDKGKDVIQELIDSFTSTLVILLVSVFGAYLSIRGCVIESSVDFFLFIKDWLVYSVLTYLGVIVVALIPAVLIEWLGVKKLGAQITCFVVAPFLVLLFNQIIK